MDGDQPRVRGFLLWFADEKGFYFHTGTTKNVYKQLKKNPKTEVVFFAPHPNQMESRMMRVAGKVKFLDDIALKSRLMEERPFLKAIGTGKPDDQLLAVFQIYTLQNRIYTINFIENLKSCYIVERCLCL